MEMSRTLFGYWRSSASYRVRIALAWKGLDYTDEAINLRLGQQGDAAFLGLNPQGLVPIFTDGDMALSQSLAIIEYLEEQWPEPPLLPGDAPRRAQVRAVAQLIACDIHPLNNLRVLNYLREPLGQSEEAVRQWSCHWIEDGLRALERMAGPTSGRFLFGDDVTLADICLVPQLYNARRVDADLSAFPRLLAVEATLADLPAFRCARPERQGDAPVAA